MFEPGSRPKPVIALLPWGNIIEDFLQDLGVSLETFCQEFTGSWLFGYIEALRLAEVETVLFCISSNVKTVRYYLHQPTGATVCVLPVSWSYRILQKYLRNPYGRTVNQVFGELKGWRRYLLFPWLVLLREILLYLPTPPLRLIRELKRLNCKAILCQEYEYPRFDVCALSGKLLGIPVFASFQGGDYQRSRLERYLRPLTLKICAGLIIPTKNETERVLRCYNLRATKICRIFNPVNLAIWQTRFDKQEVRERLAISDTARVAVWHGRVAKTKKGLDLLLQAWQQVCQNRSEQDLWLLIVGTGKDAPELHDYARQLSLDKIIWIDHFFHEKRKIAEYLSAADLFVFPSRHEGFPVAVIEAMASGLPVVASDVSGIADLLEGEEVSGGLIVPCNDPTRLAEAIEDLLLNPATAIDLAGKARRRVEATCSPEQVGQQLRAFLLGEPLVN